LSHLIIQLGERDGGYRRNEATEGAGGRANVELAAMRPQQHAGTIAGGDFSGDQNHGL
jgi:hypothetical protein